jgi:hypothetical protein
MNSATRGRAAATPLGKFESEGRRVRKDGTKLWAYVIIDPIRDSNGKTVGYAKVTRDLAVRRSDVRICGTTFQRSFHGNTGNEEIGEEAGS